MKKLSKLKLNKELSNEEMKKNRGGNQCYHPERLYYCHQPDTPWMGRYVCSSVPPNQWGETCYLA